ncbi:MAG: DMT family transporter [Balneolales bacterium]|nr:DMT family transporter [Balneolales bacterium]
MRLSLLLAAGLSTFAFAPILVRYAGDTDPVFLAAIRTVTAFFILLPVWMVQRVDGRIKSWPLEENRKAAAAGVFLALHFICWFASLTYTSVASASVLVTIHPVILIVVETVTRTGRYSAISWAGVAVAFSGSLVLGLTNTDPAPTFSNPLLGNSLAVLAAVFFVFYILLSRGLRVRADWLDFIFRVYAGTALGCVIAIFVMGSEWTREPIVWICGILLAIGPQILGHGSINYAVKYVAPTLLSTLILVEPVFAILLAAALFTEIPNLQETLSMFVIMAGVGLCWWGSRG